MYTEFYNLKEKPFNLTPSPRFLYLGETHKEALALITYGIMEQKGFVLLTGEVGTGKTTIVQTLLENLDSSVKYVYLSNPTLSPPDFLSYVATSLGLETKSTSKSSLLAQFEGFLKQFIQNQQKVLLIVDEAQKLSLNLLEEIRLLSNLETADEKLINIFLVGQPELNQTLRNAKCRPLLQRISIRYHINPLNLMDTEAYIKTRLKAAGAGDLRIFSREVIKLIHKYAKGYPRMINILCDNALLLGYSTGNRRITPAMIEECYKDLQLPDSFLQKDTDSSIGRELKRIEPVEKRSYLRAATLSVILFLVFSTISFSSFGQQYLKRAELFYREYFSLDLSSSEKTGSNLVQNKVKPITNENDKNIIGQKVEMAKIESVEKLQTQKSQFPAKKSPEKYKIVQNEKPRGTEKKIVTVKPGDTLLALAMEIYGYADGKMLEWIEKENPEIKDVNMIEVGQKIVFPHTPLLTDKSRAVYSVNITSFKTLELAQPLFQGLVSKGYEAYILSFVHPQQGKMFRVAVGAFEEKESAKDYGKQLLDMGVVDYAEPIRIDLR